MGIHRDRESSRRSRTKTYMDFMTSTGAPSPGPVNHETTPRAINDTIITRAHKK